MKLARVHAREFWSIQDSNSFDIGDITCLVGKNEAGKTALLKALYRLNPINEPDGKFDVTDDYPRANVTDYQQAVESGRRGHAVVIEATFALETEDLSTIHGDFGDDVLVSTIQLTDGQGQMSNVPELTMVKGYDNKVTFRLKTNEKAAGKTLLEKANLLEQLDQSGEHWDDLRGLSEVLEKRAARQQVQFNEAYTAANGIIDPDEKTAAVAQAQLLQETAAAKNLRTLLQTVNASGLARYIYENHLQKYIPQFLYFDEYYQMRGCENIDALQQRITTSTLQPSDHPLIGLIEIAGLKLAELVNPNRTRELINKLEGAGNHLTKQIIKYWSQNRYLQLKFDVRPARPGDPQDMQKGTNIWGAVYDSKHYVTTDLGSRSRGFVWFFSFLAWYSRQRKNPRLILLLDEPGLSLHGKAQEDLLRHFEQELKGHHQLIYTTHSPFMVDPRHFERVRIVQDRGIDTDEPLPPAEEGTKVLTEVLDATPDSLFPLQGALGYEIYQTLFIGPNCLIVEGFPIYFTCKPYPAFLVNWAAKA